MNRLLLASAFTLGATPALACSLIAPPAEHVIDPSSSDAQPPSTPQIVLAELRQDHGSPAGDSCGDISSLAVELTAATDDQSPEDAIGYRFEIVDGSLPRGLVVPAVAERPNNARPGTARFIYTFGESNADVRFSIRALAVDEAGNEGSPSAPVTVTGSSELLGCSAAAAPVGGALQTLALVAGAIALARRRG